MAKRNIHCPKCKKPTKDIVKMGGIICAECRTVKVVRDEA